MKKILSSALLTLSLTGCAPDGVYRLGLELGSLELDYYSPTMGVYPDTSILDDPSNPFSAGLSDDDKWQLESEKSNAGYTVACFYAWATMVAYQPTGEHQYYTAVALHDMFLREEAAPEDLYHVQALAISAYQAVLDHFPDSVSYLADGETTFSLAPLAYSGIVSLGGTPQGGWVEVTTSDGGTAVVQAR